MSKARNDLTSPVPKFCLVLEASRRTNEGRVRTPQELLTHFFPYSEGTATDRLFHFLPREVRGPILTSWGVRGQKSALRDSDDKVRAVVHDALVAGDVDASMFEASLAADVFVRWIDLPDWWSFWRGGKLAKYSILKALEAGYDLGLFDAEWFLQTVASKDGKTRGTDLLSEGLSKADLTEWLRAIYLTADGSPRGIVAALGWDQIVSKTPDEVLIAVLDAIALKVGLKEDGKAKEEPKPKEEPRVKEEPKAKEEAKAKAAPQPDPLEDIEETRPPLETWTPAPVPVDEAEPRPAVPSAKPAAVPIASISRPEAKPARKLPAIFIPASARQTDPPAEPKPAAPPPPAAPRDSVPEESGNLFRDDEISISAEAFDDLLSERSPSVRPAEEVDTPPKKEKRPSKRPTG